MDEWRIDTYRPSVPGADYDVIVMHIPTGTVARCVVKDHPSRAVTAMRQIILAKLKEVRADGSEEGRRKEVLDAD